MAAVRKQKLEELLKSNPDVPAENLADEVGINSGKSLCSYLRRHFDLTLTTMRKKALQAKWNETYEKKIRHHNRP